MIERAEDEQRLKAALERSPIVLLVGPRQAGKSTLAKTVVGAAPSNRFDLEDPRDAFRLGEATMTLPSLSGTVVIDEAQRRPDLFPILRVLADEMPTPGRFLVLGSASPDLVGLRAESVAGRVTILELSGLAVRDLGASHLDELWRRGGLPRSVLAGSDVLSSAWRDDYIATFLERDLANLGVRIPPTTMRRFWTMLAHFHGQTWNGAELSRALGVSQVTVRRYLDALTDALVVRQLQPWFANISKRQVKAPKVYIRDSGLLHRLLGVSDSVDLFSNPKVGASWEGFVIEQLLQILRPPEAYVWGTHNGAELDLFVPQNGKRLGFEIKRTEQPQVTPSMRSALADLELDHLYVVHAGQHRFSLHERVTAIPASDLLMSDGSAL